MLDLIAQTFRSLDQAGLLLGGTACLILGGVLAGSALHWRIRGTRVQGRVIGVRTDKNVHYPVYRYRSEDGVERDAMSTTGSSGTRGKETGRELSLLTLSGRPTEAHESASYAFDVAGWLLVLVGGGLLYLAFSLRPVGVGTWLMLGLLAAYLAMKMQRAWKPAANRGSLAGWRAAAAARRLERWANVPVVPIEDLVAAPATAKQQKVNRLWGPVLLAIGFGLFGLGVHLALEPPALGAGAWNWIAPIGVLAIGTFFSWAGVGMTRQSWRRA
jgi:hypothetical protein